MQIAHQRKAASPELISELYGIPTGTLANLRSKREGPQYYKAGKRKVLYFIDDVETWLRKKPVLTSDCLAKGGKKQEA